MTERPRSPIFDCLIEGIGGANIRYPYDIHNNLREQKLMPYEEAVHLANAAILHLLHHRYDIFEIDTVEKMRDEIKTLQDTISKSRSRKPFWRR